MIFKKPEAHNPESEERGTVSIPVQTAGDADPETPAAPPAPDPQAAERKRLAAELDALRDTLARRQADFDNARKRFQRERAEEAHRTTARLATELLPVLDSFDRALAADRDAGAGEFLKGFELIERQLREVLARMGVQPIEALGQAFDPRIHEAVERVDSAQHADGTVVGEVQRGYRLGETILRPAQVRVAVHPAPDPRMIRPA